MILNRECDNIAEQEEHLVSLLKLNLWGNRSDLYLSSRTVTSHVSALDLLQSFNDDILVDDSKKKFGNFYMKIFNLKTKI